MRFRRKPDDRGDGLVEPGTLVLVVDDDPDVASTIADTLALEGYSAKQCVTAEGALAQIAAGLAPAVVILDLWIPAMGSSQFSVRLRALLPATPILLLSGSAADLQRSHLAANARLVKPVEWSTLVRNVDKLVRSQAMTSGGRSQSRVAGDKVGRNRRFRSLSTKVVPTTS